METYYDWTIISYDVPPSKSRHKQVLVECTCGTQKIIKLSVIKNGYSQGCGCKRSLKISENTRKRNTTHGKSGTRLHRIWKLIRQRCNNINATGYNNYGGKGIKLCPEWNDFLTFEAWAIENGYEEGLTLERVDPNKDYEPSNCEWITKSQNIARRNKGIAGTGKTFRSRFTEKDIEDMKYMRNEGVTYDVIAGAFATSISHVSRLVKDEIKYYRK